MINCDRCMYMDAGKVNCTAVGGFCTAVPAAYCPMLQEFLDAGMMPEEIKRTKMEIEAGCVKAVARTYGIDINRLREMAAADRDGRVIVTDAPPADDKRDGLRQKYRVYKAKNNTPVEDCFVLRPEKDPAARIALEAYAKATENKVLAEDILAAIGDSGRVVILPCEPGTPVYMTFCGEVWEMRVGQFHVNGYTEPRIWADIDCDWASTQCVRWDLAVGKTVFLTREEAEKALEEKKDD